jgi:predicted Ser/Thr protein kinase
MTHEATDATPVTLDSIAEAVASRFKAERRVLAFDEYLALFDEAPVQNARDASRYLRDCFLHYGSRTVARPWGEAKRWNLFDLPWEEPEDGTRPRGALVGQEEVQEEIFRAVSNYAREGKPTRLVFLHGPNGSAKSTTVSCLFAALEHYATKPEGALYCFSFVFPTTKTLRGSLGFGSEGGTRDKPSSSFAHLADEALDAKIAIEPRDHPLFLLPVEERRRYLESRWARLPGGTEPPPRWLLEGQLSHKAQQIVEALLGSHGGDFREVLRHVRVERYFLSRRYRVGAITVGPQMHVDAGERQLTADRSLANLPASLQAISMYEARGELVDAAGGLLEFSDLLKRPLDAFKYLQLTVETGEVALSQQNVQLNCVMIASANELHLDAFREHPEYASFRGRFEPVRVPYLLSYEQERELYETLVVPQTRVPAAPHAAELAAIFAVLTRMRKPVPERFGKALGAIVASLSAIEKAELYAHGRAPERLSGDEQKLLANAVAELVNETAGFPIYEGRVGASPREMRVALLDAAQSPKGFLSPLAVLEAIDVLCQRKSDFEWLKEDNLPGLYHDVKAFRTYLLERLQSAWAAEFDAASGLVDEKQYGELFERYVQHVSVWVKGERLYDRVTRQEVDPDEKMMQEVEGLLGVTGDRKEARQGLISSIAAWSIDHPGEKIDAARVFPQKMKVIHDAVFADRRAAIGLLLRDVTRVLHGMDAGLEEARRAECETVITRLRDRFGYLRPAAAEMCSHQLRKRFPDIVT